jgi:hypothetical protein
MDGIWFDMIDWLDAKVGTPKGTRDRSVVDAGDDAQGKRISRAESP